MTIDKGTLARKRTEGPRLAYTAGGPEGTPKLAVALVHGYADHSARYAHVIEAWAARGIATVGVDLRGHGRAEGTRGHCERFGQFLDDVRELTAFVEERHPDAPKVLFGHSFGGLVAASAVLEQAAPYKALALSGPFFGVAMKVPRLKVLAGRLASKLAPDFAQPSGIPASALTHDEAIVRAYELDPLVFKTATARWFTETTDAQERAIALAPSLSMPLTVVIGAADPIVSVPRARTFFDAAGSKDKTWDARAGLLHEVLMEREWKGIAEQFADWMLARAAG